MSAIDLLRQGCVADALEQLKDDVRENPQDPKHRIFLFQLFAITGDWDRAMAQLRVAAELDDEAVPMKQAYEHVLQCEALRREVFLGKRSPLLFGEPDLWMAKMLQALRLVAEGDFAAAANLRGEALQEAPAYGGKLTLRSRDENEVGSTSEFDWIADADSRIGPFLEVILQGKFYWVPWERVQSIQFHEVKDLRDCVWIPAEFTWVGGGELVGMMPVRYVRSESDSDGLIQLARKTDWEQHAGDTFVGKGQRMLTTDQDDIAILDIESIVCNNAM